MFAAFTVVEPVVVNGDSDFFIYPNIRAVYRPTSDQEFLFYDVAECWHQLGLSRAKLTALGSVCHNDYSDNIHGFAVATNLSIIKSLGEDPVLTDGALVESIVEAYCASVEIRGANPMDPAHFDAAIQIFAHGVATLMRGPDETQVDQLLGVTNTRVSDLLQRVEAYCCSIDVVPRSQRAPKKKDEIQSLPGHRRCATHATVCRWSTSPASAHPQSQSPNSRLRVRRHKWNRRYSVRVRRDGGNFNHAIPRGLRRNHWRRGRAADEVGGQVNEEDKDDEDDEEANQPPEPRAIHRPRARRQPAAVDNNTTRPDLVKRMARAHQNAVLSVGSLGKTSCTSLTRISS
ncbi:MAG: hypothetical protein J3Q66DRAFT_386270 [Benniella sp.]|nr:MAG: hypothetical protein J3Q66DRAFT_386270 [Benniella sp.]